MALKYDLLGRVLRKTYTDTSNTPEVVYCYDGDTQRSGCAAAPAGAGQNLAGRLTLVANAVASVKYGPYDGLGRVTNHAVVMDGQTYSFQYGYHELGLKKEVYPGGRELSYGFDGAGRVTQVAETSSDVFVSNYASGITYEASGAMRRMVLGNAKVQDQCYNQRLQLTGLRVGDAGDSTCQSGSGMVLGLGVGYGVGNNGNVASQSIQIGAAVVGAQSYTYDALNRLKTAVETKAAGGVAWTQTYVYDRHGNRAVLGASVPAPATGIPQVTVDDSAEVTGLLRTREDPVTQAAVVTNQWQSASVDEAGNVTAPKTGAYPHTLEYDGENRLVSAVTGVTGTMTAAYDGEGRRVKKTENGVVTVYVHDAAGRLAQEYGGAASGVSGRQYLVGDHLGSTRLTMNGTGVVRRDYYPFGEEVEAGTGDRTTAQGYQTAGTAAADGMRVRFTGKERDAETANSGMGDGLDYFGARYFSGAQGRFTSADEPLLDQSPHDPQSWNLYAYVRNNPLRFSDPTGRECVTLDNGTTGDDGKGTVCKAVTEADKNKKPDVTVSDFEPPSPMLLAVAQGAQQAGPVVNAAGYATGGVMVGAFSGMAYGAFAGGQAISALGLTLLPSQARNIEAIENAIANHVTLSDLSGAAKETAGFTIRTGNKVWNHRQELIETARNLRGAVRALQGSLNDPRHGAVAREVVQQAIQKAETALRQIDAALRR